MLHRIRLAMQDEDAGKFQGHVEVDETFIGGKARFMHKKQRVKMTQPGMPKGGANKVIVGGVLERGGKVRTQILENRERQTLQGLVRDNVEYGSQLSTDDCHSYWGLDKEYAHGIVDHAKEYVNGQIHTNGLENFWSLVKRGLKGTYISVEPFHLFRYLDEQVFRYNNRATKKKFISDYDRFSMVTDCILGKRITYEQLIGRATQLQFGAEAN
jgi:transposase-like protein